MYNMEVGGRNMGICYLDLRFYWQTKLTGVSFQDTVTIGHQNIHLYPIEIKLLRKAYYKEFPNSKIDPLAKSKFGGYADGVLADLLGIQNLATIDYSGYEGATIIHDLNLPIPNNLEGKFDVVIDGGSLEHIFNFPIAISNLMKMSKVGGKLFITVPANNYCGHGFYQFSPELMFRIFVQDNGFKLDKLIFYPARNADFGTTPILGAYEVIDPAKLGVREELVTTRPLLMMVEATKMADVPLFAISPLQSDYVIMWNSESSKHQFSGANKPLIALYHMMPLFLQSRIKSVYMSRTNALSNSKYYHKVKM